jgi:peptidoglycan/LPS O-acetylase OafA/YrhL
MFLESPPRSARVSAPNLPQTNATDSTHAKRISYLDGWRGIAILLLLLGHFFPINGINLGRLGVDFFFVLSGRLMADILFARKTPLPQFFLRRVSRVYPGLFVFVLLAAAAFMATPIHVGLLGILSALTFTINYASIYFHRTGIFDHIWSLCIEEHAYIILGGLAYASRRFGTPASAVMLAIGVAAILNGVIQTDVFHRDYFDVYWRTDVQVAPIMLGGWFFLHRQKIRSSLIAKASPVFIGLAVLCKFGIFIAAIRFGLGTICLALAVCLLDTAPAFFQRLLSLPPLRQIGLWSYSLYLWQQPFYQMDRLDHAYWRLPAAIICGLLSFYLIEQPARNFINSRIRAVRPARA